MLSMAQHPEYDRVCRRSVFRRVGTTFASAALVIASLLTFPSGIPWMIGGWILGHTLLAARRRPAWAPLIACLVIVLVKRPYWPPALVALALAMLATAAIYRSPAATASHPHLGYWRPTCTSLLWGAWIWLAWDWHADSHCSRSLVLDKTRPVACIGDSLTSGVPPFGGYPDDLAARLAVPVVNLGRAGITAEDALLLLPELIRARPQTVVVELGGHDYLRGRSRAATHAVLERIITQLRGAGAEVVLMEIPRGFLTDPYAGLEREIARQYDLELISDSAVRQLVLFSPYAPPGMWIGGRYLSDDGLHPNARGNAHLANCVARSLSRIYGRQIETAGPRKVETGTSGVFSP
jgi:lysophospholipase L1-like esterase